MASTFTPNINLEEPARGDDVGTWDTPVNANMTLIDLVVGGQASIPLNNSPVVLSPAQFQSKTITFSSTLTGNVFITFPTSFVKSYEIRNTCTGSSAFFIQLGTTAAGGQVIAAPPGEIVGVMNGGLNLFYKDFGRVGSYLDYAGSSVPNWVQACTINPYLPCDGSVFSAVTYPALATILGGTTLPDSRGRARYALDAGVGRVSSGVSGVAGNTRLAGGGDQSLQSHSHANVLADPGHFHYESAQINVQSGVGLNVLRGDATPPSSGLAAPPGNITSTVVSGVTITNAVSGAGGAQNMPPVYIGGITLIRSG